MAKKLKAAEETKGLDLVLKARTELYSTRRTIGSDTQKKLGLRIPFDVYYKDPLVAKNNPGLDIDADFHVPWEPGISHGPTSARFAVVDYDSTNNILAEPAQWKRGDNAFVDPKGNKVDASRRDTPQFRQVSTWAILQNTLDYFESGHGLGRRILWGFEGNRLLVVPQAGVGENAYYDRHSKSLQFYYFDEGDSRVYTCLSSDIVNHEFGHAVLDGIRPHYLEAVSPQTGAFHEFLGDLTAILMTLRNASFRKALADQTKGDLSKNNLLADLAQQFGDAVDGQAYLRSGVNNFKLKGRENDLGPHKLSQVMTGAMFDIVVALTSQYIARAEQGKKISVRDALAYTTQRMQEIAIQPLDFLPPVEVTFRDYALAVLRNLELADPLDPGNYRKMIIDIFVKREILDKNDKAELLRSHHLLERAPGGIFHDAATIAVSRAEAYRFLDDNRDDLFIPDGADIVVSEVFTAEKMAGAGRRQPKQILVQYLWREEIELTGKRFGRFAGKMTSLLCGATLVLDENGSLLAWARKPGTEPTATAARALIKQKKGGALFATEKAALDEMKAGVDRRAAYLDALSRRIKAGMVGDEIGGELGLLAKAIPPLTTRTVDGSVRFELSPHFAIHDHDPDDEDDIMGGRQWQISS